MKKLGVILVLALLLMGCASVSARTRKTTVKSHKAKITASAIVTPVPAVSTPISTNNTTSSNNVSYYFARATPNVDLQLINVINSSKTTLDIAIYSLTKKSIVDAIIAAKNRGINVELMTDKIESKSKSEKAELALLQADNIPIKINTHSGLLHIKMTVTDSTVTTGSYNYTQAATTENDEVLVIIKDATTAKAWKAEFDSMWNDNKNYANY